MVRCVHCPAQAGTPSWVPPMTLSSPSLSSFHQILFHLLYNFMILLILFYFLFATTAMAQSYSVLARDSHVVLHNRDPPEIIGNLKLLHINCHWKKIEILWPLTIFLECSLSSVTVSCTVPGHLTDWVRVESWEVAERGTQTRLVTQPNPGQYGTSTIWSELFAWFLLAWKSGWMPKYKKYLYTLKIFVCVCFLSRVQCPLWLSCLQLSIIQYQWVQIVNVSKVVKCWKGCPG